ncbi:hypothetical protein FOZ60_009554 [Perkinsus olseni]|uniref:Uncharacterized protein n=1 Tax=Perkinsus olseni TaxID=32597 RepID=A0A7J6NJB5_PEROL|nr:hypothetical protein FOZ60_009554 [Perkinsus olseni]
MAEEREVSTSSSTDYVAYADKQGPTSAQALIGSVPQEMYSDYGSDKDPIDLELEDANKVSCSADDLIDSSFEKAYLYYLVLILSRGDVRVYFGFVTRLNSRSKPGFTKAP